MSRLGDALRQKFSDPRDLLKALGLDASLLDGARKEGTMSDKPTRLEFLATHMLARAVNPLLAMDKQVDYAPIVAGLTRTNFKERKPKIVADLKAALKGKTIAKDAELNMGHVASMLDEIEHNAESERSYDESVSGEQHRAMAAAAKGHSNLGIPQDVGEEFLRADKGKTFNDAADPAENLGGWLQGKDEKEVEEIRKAVDAHLRGHGMSEDESRTACDMIFKKRAGGRDASEDVKAEEERKKRLEDEARIKREEEAAGKDRRMARDGMVTKDQMDATIKAALVAQEKKIKADQAAIRMALDEVRPYVGELTMAFDSAEQVRRQALKMLDVEGHDTIHESALSAILKMQPKAGARPNAPSGLAQDSAAAKSYAERFPEAARIVVG